VGAAAKLALKVIVIIWVLLINWTTTQFYKSLYTTSIPQTMEYANKALYHHNLRFRTLLSLISALNWQVESPEFTDSLHSSPALMHVIISPSSSLVGLRITMA